MAIRIFSAAAAALMMASSATAQTTFPVCHITSTGTPMTFETKYVAPEDIEAMETDGDIYGVCRDFLGQLCDDGMACTIDYDYEEAKCLDFPRVTVPDCRETI